MRVRMLTSCRGAVDPAGTQVVWHVAGEAYDLPEPLAIVYLEAGFAVPEDAGPSEMQKVTPGVVPAEPIRETADAAPSEPVRHRGGWPKGRRRK